MQQTGTLRKRRKRNLAKVNGLFEVEYDENQDFFMDQEKYGIADVTTTKKMAINDLTRQQTRIQLGAANILEHRRIAEGNAVVSSRNRVTRNPRYHKDSEHDFIRVITEPDTELPWHAGGNDKVISGHEIDVSDTLKNRSHILDGSTLRRLKQIILLGASCGAFPWKWNEKMGRIDNWSCSMQKLWKMQWVFFTVLSCFLCIFQLYTFYKRLSLVGENDSSYRDVFQNYFTLHWYLLNVLCNVNMYYHMDAMRHYINTMLAFNQAYEQNYVVHLNGHKLGGRFALNVVTIASIGQVFARTSVFLRMSYQPWFLFSYIYPKPWYWLIPGGIQEYTVVGHVITSYCLILWILVSHTNTLQFWLIESHKDNDSDYTTDELRTSKSSIETYKALLVLNQSFNQCMAPMATGWLKLASFSCLVPCGYILVRSMNHLFIDEFGAVVTYIIGLWDCALTAFVIITMSAGVFDLGCGFTDSWGRTKHKSFRRILMSCPAMKVWVGRIYFFSASTTLTFFKVVFDIITDFVIACP